MATTTQTLIDTIIAACKPRLRSWSSRMAAKRGAARVLSPLVPEGTLQWLEFPRAGESARSYASRALGSASSTAIASFFSVPPTQL